MSLFRTYHIFFGRFWSQAHNQQPCVLFTYSRILVDSSDSDSAAAFMCLVFKQTRRASYVVAMTRLISAYVYKVRLIGSKAALALGLSLIRAIAVTVTPAES